MIEKFLENYILSKSGDVINKKTKKILKPHLRTGYPSVSLSYNNKRKTYSVHQLMIFYFYKKKSTRYMVVNHIDSNRQNNNLDNLEIITQKENVIKAFQTNQRNIHTKPIIQYSLNMEKINEFNSIQDAEKETGIGNRMISRVCKKERNQTGGFVWRYKNDEYLHIENFDLSEYQQIKNYPNYYIDKCGNIYSKRLKRKMTPFLNQNNYIKIKLCNNGQQKDYYIHRLVGLCFLPNPNPNPNNINKNQINHKDGNRQNNNVENLEWVTCSENVKHSHDFLRNKSKSKSKNI